MEGMSRKIGRNLMWCMVVFLVGLVSGKGLYAHCQMPCGIYDDGKYFSDLKERVEVLKKAVAKITAKSEWGEEQVRWVDQKEHQAQGIQESILNYFLSQRVKLPSGKESVEKGKAYVDLLKVSHRVIVGAMKIKQKASKKNINKLEKAVLELELAYNAYNKSK